MNKYAHGDAPRRREEILRIVRKKTVHSQEELLTLLHQAGFDATQPTLSRDIRELGLAKTPEGYALVGRGEGSGEVISFITPQRGEEKLHSALAEYASRVEQAGNLIVIKTATAGAQPLALVLDAAALPDVLGTIAGDDTIFLAARTVAAAARLTRQLREPMQPTRPVRRARA